MQCKVLLIIIIKLPCFTFIIYCDIMQLEIKISPDYIKENLTGGNHYDIYDIIRRHSYFSNFRNWCIWIWPGILWYLKGLRSLVILQV